MNYIHRNIKSKYENIIWKFYNKHNYSLEMYFFSQNKLQLLL